jgi:Helicase HerA, central domain
MEMIATANKQEIRLGTRVKAPGDGSDDSSPRRSSLDGRLLSIPAESLTRHMCIFGRAGAGKSVTAMILASELHSIGRVSVVVLDRTGEFACSTLASLPGVTVYSPGDNFTISPFVRRSDNRDDDVERYISLMYHFVECSWSNGVFSPYQERALREALKTCYGYDSSRLSDVLSELEEQAGDSRDKVEWWLEGNQAVISRLAPIASGSLARVFDVDAPGVTAADFFQPGLCIVNLGLLETDQARNMASQILCRLFIDHGKKLGQTNDLRFVLIVDEAQHLAPNRQGYRGILQTYTELKKYGMGLVVVAPRPTNVSEDIIANSKTVVFHSLTSGKDIKLARNYMVSRPGAEKFETDLRTLEVGECLIQLNDPSTIIPAGCRVGLPEHGFLLVPAASVPVGGPIDTSKADSLVLSEEVAEEDSAQAICEKLPMWARQAAKLTADLGGSISRRSFMDRGHTPKQIKQIVSGQYPLLEENEPILHLTPLGRKVAMIEDQLNQGRHGTEVVSTS